MALGSLEELEESSESEHDLYILVDSYLQTQKKQRFSLNCSINGDPNQKLKSETLA